jgi:PhnB protein
MSGKPTRPGFHTVTPYLIVPELEPYLAFLKAAFDATELWRSTGAAGGTHVELRIGDSMLMVSGGADSTPLPTMLFLYLEAVDSVYQAALAAGATSLLEPGPNFGEPRGAGVQDLAGNQWYFARWEAHASAPPGYPTPSRDDAGATHPAEAASAAPSPVVPMLTYEDGPAAMDWLIAAFGFQEVTRWLDADGRLSHGEMLAGGGRIMLASVPGYESPKRHREACERTRAWSAQPWVIDGVLVYVADVDRHCAQARQQGATILSEPNDDGPGRLYRAEDLEGHRWMFLQAQQTEETAV